MKDLMKDEYSGRVKMSMLGYKATSIQRVKRVHLGMIKFPETNIAKKIEFFDFFTIRDVLHSFNFQF